MIPNVPETILDELMPPFPENERMGAFVLLDAARDEQIYPAVLRADCDWSCLYRGDAAVTMAEVAPYLVRLDRGSQFTPWVIDKAWGNSWGVFFNAAATMEALRNHFRRFVFVQLPDGRNVYFRFYDPRVLRVYLPTCAPVELTTIFGPVERYVIETEEGALASFRVEEEALSVVTSTLPARAAR